MANINGTAASDSLIGTQGADVISAGAGNDTVSSLGGNDQISGDRGNDTLFGGAGRDTLDGGAGLDALFGQAGIDTLNGNNGSDSLNGGAGGDSLNGDAGDDTLSGQAGFDTLNGGIGGDNLNGDVGNDSVIGGAGNDSLSGGNDNDILIGVDPFNAELGFGAGEVDTLTGGEQSDRFVLAQDNEVLYDDLGNSDFALITDFNLSQDVIQILEDSEESGTVSESGEAGQLITNAQVIPEGSATLDSISGEISSNNDVDLFQITLDGGDFSATTVDEADFDTQLFLFDEDGFLVAENDDANEETGQSTLSLSSPDAGTYFLAISSFDNDPVGSPLSGFTGEGEVNGSYTIDLTGVQFAGSTAFSLGASPAGLPSGTGIFSENDLIAIVQGVSIPNFNNGFDFA
jgi:Ca2+-binding RTX toxin-like protein